MAPAHRGTPAAAQAETMRSASSRVWAIGFSTAIARAPHSTARQARSARPRVLVATTTMSSPSARSISAASV